jgi:hypothetical protein
METADQSGVRDFYSLLSVDVPHARGPEPDPQPDPSTVITATIETVDNDRALTMVELVAVRGGVV